MISDPEIYKGVLLFESKYAFHLPVFHMEMRAHVPFVPAGIVYLLHPGGAVTGGSFSQIRDLLGGGAVSF